MGFDPQGGTLVATDKTNNNIFVYLLGRDGLPAMNPVVSQSSGLVPFGFTFDQRGHLLVVEAGTNAVSSYNILPDGNLQVISPSVANGQKAACWIAVDQQGYIFTDNPGTSSVSSYKLEHGSGQLALINGTAGSGKTPLDLSIVTNQFLYALDPQNAGIDMFKIEPGGSLTNLGTAAGELSIFAQGIAAR